jgi:uncharacterized damage-inducible protein DinB
MIYGARELATSFRTVRGNTLEIARDIPEDKYGFTPAPGTRTVSELLRHIVYAPMVQEDMHRVNGVTTLKGYDFGAIVGTTAALERVERSKEEIIELLRAEGDRFASWLESLSPEFLGETFTDPTGANPRTRLENLMGVKEHEMHHRGQLMLMERMLGIVPHLTRRREERARRRQEEQRSR